MSNQSFQLSDAVYRYLLEVSLRELDILRRLREETRSVRLSQMQISPEQGQFMSLLIHLIGARKCLEIGTYTGYSALVVALALPADGKLICCDINEEWTAIARRYWQEANVADQIELRLQPALATLEQLHRANHDGSFDFVFIDADKPSYAAYFDHALKLVRPGGLIAVDNTLWYGRVADPSADDEDTRAIRAFNAKLAGESRVRLSLIPMGDGLTLAQKI